jgi:hypothetical protein
MEHNMRMRSSRRLSLGVVALCAGVGAGCSVRQFRSAPDAEPDSRTPGDVLGPI